MKKELSNAERIAILEEKVKYLFIRVQKLEEMEKSFDGGNEKE